eukprot:TRINITY_DN93958_c0_g1_i1.p1 TRINITY_DN93958_c0_g1~~TRINITY_DN93958_c0_g1_i1.p1  ORF type:complete len:295 (+),score=67.61 TRINITY_DN93958_c0_g1_i1:96-980(+)
MPGVHEGDFEIWWAPNKHERVHQIQKAWTIVAKGYHAGRKGQMHQILMQRSFTVPEGERHALLIMGQTTNAVCFSTDTQVNVGENDDVKLHLGHYKSYPWESQLSTSPFGHSGMQGFIGIVEYQVLQTNTVDIALHTAQELWSRRSFADAQVLSADGKTFSVHRAVLASASHVLEAAWTVDMKEKEERQIRIDSNSECVESLLCFMYTGQECGETDPGEMLRLAHLFGLPALVLLSAHRLAQGITSGNAVASVRALRPYREEPDVCSAWQALVANIQSMLAGDAGLLEEVLLSV